MEKSDYAGGGSEGWWLRTIRSYTDEDSRDEAKIVEYDGYVDQYGTRVSSEYGIVPVLHIDISSNHWTMKENKNFGNIISDFQIDNTAETASGSEATISGTLTLSDEAETSSDLLQSEVSKITWNSSDSGVAEVKGCTGQNASDNRSSSLTITIAAKKAGTAIITGTTSNGKKASCTVTVKGGTVPETISDFQIDNTAEAASGSEATISGTLTLSDEAEASSDLLKSEVSKITWNSSDSGVAEVKGCTGQNASDNRSTSLTVTIAAKKAGIAVITGTTSNGKKASCTVTVKGTTVSETPKNPVHHCTKENDGTDTTDWSYVYFGSYPQTEVTGAALTPAITGASYDENKDAWVNGVKYRRISKSDMNYDGYFGDSEYRYFKWERMKWRVLQNNGSTMFVVADKGLDCKDYNDTYEPVTWEDCTLRNWLNNDFYNMAFSDSEQGAVIGQTVSNEDNLEYGTAGGNNTADKVYLLSDRELTDRSYGFCEDYNVWSASRRFNTSDYSCARGASRDCDDEGNQYCWWWLRSPGRSTYEAINVDTDGRIKQDGTEVLISCDVSLAVIPALHIDLSSNLWSLAEADKPNIPNIPDCTHTHTELRNQKNSTCQAAGYSGDKWCKDCQKQIETGKTLAKTAHNLQTTVTKATDSKNGSIQKKCKLCGFVQSNTVINRIQSASVSQTKYTYDGTKKQPTVSVLDSAGKKIDSQYYTVSYQNNASVGTASAVITFKGNYSGTLVKNFDINSQTTRITKVKAKNKGFEAKWKKQASQTTGYQLQYSTSKKFTKKTTKTKTVKKSSKTNLTIGKLKSGKKYYVRIRTYQTVNGTKYYSEWSKSKKITTKRS